MSPEETAAGTGAKTESGAEDGKATESNPFLNVLLPVLTVVGTGIGAIGFVIFFGGFIVWTRFDAAGLPANEAVAQVPRNDLVVTGASFLVPALLAAFAAVIVAVAGWDALIGSPRRHLADQAKAEHSKAGSRLEQLEAEGTRLASEIKELRVEMDERDNEAKVAPPGEERELARRAYDEADTERRERQGRLLALRENDLPAAKNSLADITLRQSEGGNPRHVRLRQLAVGGIPMLAAELYVIAIGWGGLHWGYRGLLVLVAAMTIVAAVVVLSMSDHFAWFSLCVFIGVGITIAFSTYARTQSHVKVSPLAAIDGSSPVAGFFVAETSDAVYVGIPTPLWKERVPGDELEFDHGAVTLSRYPKASLADLTIGPLMNELEAYQRSASLALSLCRHAKYTTKKTSAATASNRRTSGHPPTTKQACAANATRQLRRRLTRIASAADRAAHGG